VSGNRSSRSWAEGQRALDLVPYLREDARIAERPGELLGKERIPSHFAPDQRRDAVVHAARAERLRQQRRVSAEESGERGSRAVAGGRRRYSTGSGSGSERAR
jgi:hypothetical protein